MGRYAMTMRPDASQFAKLYTDYGPAHCQAARLLDDLNVHLTFQDFPEHGKFVVGIIVRLHGSDRDQVFDYQEFHNTDPHYRRDVEASLLRLLRQWEPGFPFAQLDAEKAGYAARQEQETTHV